MGDLNPETDLPIVPKSAKSAKAFSQEAEAVTKFTCEGKG